MTSAWISLGRLRAVDDEVALGVARAMARKCCADRLVEGVLLGLEPVVDVTAPAATLGGADVDDHGQVGHEVVDRPHVEVVDLLGSEVATGALVGDGGVGVAVGDHHLAALEGRAGSAGSTWCALSAAKSSASARGDTWSPWSTRSRICWPSGGAPGLAGHRDLAPLAAQGVAQQRHLGGLARAVAALEGDEESVGHARSLGQRSDRPDSVC